MIILEYCFLSRHCYHLVGFCIIPFTISFHQVAPPLRDSAPLPLVRSPPLLVGGRPPPRSFPPPPPFLGYFRSAPAAPSPPSLLFSLYRVPRPYPLTCCLPACLVSSLLYPLFRLSLFQVGFFFFYLMVPGWVWVSRLLLGLPLSWLSRQLCVCCSLSLSCSRSYLRLASLSRLPHPFHLRFWVFQRILCFLPLLLVFQGVIPLSLS